MRLAELVAVSNAVAEAGGRLRKVELLAGFLARVPPEELEIAINFLTGSPRQGRIGVGLGVLMGARAATPAPEPSLELAEVDRRFSDIGAISGAGSAEARLAHLRTLLGM